MQKCLVTNPTYREAIEETNSRILKNFHGVSMLEILYTNTAYIDFFPKKNSMFIHALSPTKVFHFRNFFLKKL